MLNRKTLLMTLVTLTLSLNLYAGGWEYNSNMFNPSGVPSLTFSQPRFADMDADGDLDMILGSGVGGPLFLSNIGSKTSPKFVLSDNIFSSISELDAEVSVAYDIDADGDLDIICGGYTGLNLYRNIGNAINASFVKVDDFFNDINEGGNPVPDMGDIDNDGDLDLIVGKSESGEIRIFTNSGSDTSAIFLSSNALTLDDVGLYAYPVFTDLDNDGDLDIVSGKDGYGIVYYRNTGTASAPVWSGYGGLFPSIGTTTYFNSPAMVDINNDGKIDLIYGNHDGPLKYFKNTGSSTSPKWSENTSLFGGTIDIGAASTPFFVDKDRDGDLDMITGTQAGDIKLYRNDGNANTPAFTYSTTYTPLKHSIYSSVSFAEANGNTSYEALVGDLSGNIYYHTGSGYNFTTTSMNIGNHGAWSAPRFIDMDHDGDMDIVVGDEDGYISYYENTGSSTQPLWSIIFDYFDSLKVGDNVVPAFADLDFDGDYDLLAGCGSYKLKYFENQDGNWVEDTTMVQGLVAKQNAAPAFADLDGDGDQDLIIGNYDGYFDYYENTREVVAIKETDMLPNSYELGTYPNPFNPTTTINFQLAVDNEINLSIFDLNGKMIEKLYSGYKHAGIHNIKWNASNYSSGIYICRLMVNGRVAESKKLTLLK